MGEVIVRSGDWKVSRLGGRWLFWATAVAALILLLVGCTTFTRPATTATSRPTHTPTPCPSPSVTPTAAPTPTATPAAAITSLSAEERAVLEAIAEEVEQLRELDADAPLSLRFMTPKELHVWVVEQMTKEYPPERASHDAQVYVALELLLPDIDLYTLTLDLYSEQIAGFYDNDTDQMTVVDDETGLDALDKIVFAHEYTHDLQDRFLGLDELQAYLKAADNDDAVRAANALFEGDAQTITVLYLFNHLDELDPSALDAIQTEQLDAAPPVLREELNFPYLAGLAFVQALLQDGGWEAVNAAYDALPQSTEQILHPQKYLAAEAPIAVSLPPLTGTLGADWRLVQENTLGEFLLNLYLEVHLPAGVAKEASIGWGGDRFALYERPAGDESLLLVVTAWDSASEAAEFAAAYTAFAQDKYGGLATAEDALGAWWQGENDVTLLAGGDYRVIIIVGPDQDTLQSVWQTWEETSSVEH
jgi:hypothetical protein